MVNEPLRGAGRREVRDIPGWVASRAAGSDETETGPCDRGVAPLFDGRRAPFQALQRGLQVPSIASKREAFPGGNG
jgi:hypothetical protein